MQSSGQLGQEGQVGGTLSILEGRGGRSSGSGKTRYSAGATKVTEQTQRRAGGGRIPTSQCPGCC